MVEHVNLNFLNLKHSLIFLIIFSQLLRKNKIFSNNFRLTEFIRCNYATSFRLVGHCTENPMYKQTGKIEEF